MRIKVEKHDVDENVVVIRCKDIDEEVNEILTLLNHRMSKIIASIDNKVYMISPQSIYYVEAVDGKIFVYTKDCIYEVKESLMQIENKYHSNGLIRISKSQLINLYHVMSLKSLMYSRIEVTLNNGERLIVSRHYSQVLKMRLEIW